MFTHLNDQAGNVKPENARLFNLAFCFEEIPTLPQDARDCGGLKDRYGYRYFFADYSPQEAYLVAPDGAVLKYNTNPMMRCDSSISFRRRRLCRVLTA